MHGYTTREVAELVGLTPRQVRSFARSGLLDPGRGPREAYRFSFQDLVLLRAAAALRAADIPMRRIRRSLETLKAQLPRGRTLSEVRITAEGDDVVVRDGDARWQPDSGQLVLDFDVSDLAAQVAPLARGAAAALDQAGGLTADEWYEQALELEAVAPDEARAAYERALALDPSHVDAHVNLGRLLHEEGRPDDAEAEYRRALALNAAYSTAAFNLGTALEDLGRPVEAVQAYQQALASDPGLADAHFNLSRLYEQLGDRLAALRHLRSYKQLIEAGA
ncbi:MAG TPA: tetratricopeptide repeat protein [Longimicrobiales bacterium]|nr:tetratricopeptide repeat protein [Longimicrobiales bacterium]